MMQSNRGFPVIGWVNRNILQGLLYLSFMYQAENPPCEAKDDIRECAPGLFRMGLFTGHSSLITEGGGGRGPLRKVGQTSKGGKERDSAQPCWTDRRTDHPKDIFTLRWPRPVKGKRSEWKTSSHPEMWERSASAMVTVAVYDLALVGPRLYNWKNLWHCHGWGHISPNNRKAYGSCFERVGVPLGRTVIWWNARCSSFTSKRLSFTFDKKWSKKRYLQKAEIMSVNACSNHRATASYFALISLARSVI